MRRLVVVIGMLLAILALVTCAGSGGEGIVVTDAWARPSPMAQGNGAAYMVIRNNGSAADALVGASADFATTVELHESVMEGDMASMHPVEQIDLPAGGSVELKPGGYHIMLIGITQPLEEGQTVTITLHFAQADDIEVQAPVRQQ